MRSQPGAFTLAPFLWGVPVCKHLVSPLLPPGHVPGGCEGSQSPVGLRGVQVGSESPQLTPGAAEGDKHPWLVMGSASLKGSVGRWEEEQLKGAWGGL